MPPEAIAIHGATLGLHDPIDVGGGNNGDRLTVEIGRWLGFDLVLILLCGGFLYGEMCDNGGPSCHGRQPNDHGEVVISFL